MAGKGDKRRPTNEKKYRNNHDRIFGDKPLNIVKEDMCFSCGNFDNLANFCCRIKQNKRPYSEVCNHFDYRVDISPKTYNQLIKMKEMHNK